MKRTFYFCIVSLVCFIVSYNLSAQQHFSLSEGNPEWVYYLQNRSNTMFRKPTANTYITYTGDCFIRIFVTDTVIREDKVLNKMMCEVLDTDGNRIAPSEVLIGENPFGLAIFREEDNKVFGGMCFLDCRFTNHTPLDNEEHCSWANNLLFDFDLEVGDTLYRTMIYYYKKYTDYNFPVTDKLLISLYDGSKRYMTTYKSVSPFFKELHSIDGIGFIDADTPPFGSLIDDRLDKYASHWCQLIMFKQNDKVVYIAPREDPEDDGQYEGSRTFKAMPFYPNITPESVASGKYSFDTSAQMSKNDNSQEEYYSKYNLQGQRINTIQKGLNIVDGNKIMVK